MPYRIKCALTGEYYGRSYSKITKANAKIYPTLSGAKQGQRTAQYWSDWRVKGWNPAFDKEDLNTFKALHTRQWELEEIKEVDT
jgi:hypothetical protein